MDKIILTNEELFKVFECCSEAACLECLLNNRTSKARNCAQIFLNSYKHNINLIKEEYQNDLEFYKRSCEELQNDISELIKILETERKEKKKEAPGKWDISEFVDTDAVITPDYKKEYKTMFDIDKLVSVKWGDKT